jgi:hypothetical protein
MNIIYHPQTGEIAAQYGPEYTVEPGEGYALAQAADATGSETNVSQIPSLARRLVFEAGIAAGYLVDPEGFTIAIEPEDRAQFAQLLALVREALDLGLITGTTPQSIKAKDGTLHSLTTDRLRQVLVGYGSHYKTLWDNLNS